MKKMDMRLLQTWLVLKKKLTDDGRIGPDDARLVVKRFIQYNIPDACARVTDFRSVRVSLTVAI